MASMDPKASVLIVDEEGLIRKILARIVTREGYAVAEAADGREALEKMKKTPYDFVISAIKLPKMNGFELLTEIKTNYPETMVLLITAYTNDISAEDVLTHGADYYITRPFKNVEIARTLSALSLKLQKHRSAKSHR